MSIGREDLTKRELDCLLCMRRRPRTFKQLMRRTRAKNPESMNVMLSRMRELYYVQNDEKVTTGKITLNQIGETIAQAEFDRRFDMYYTRVISLLALVASVVALAIEAIG